MNRRDLLKTAGGALAAYPLASTASGMEPTFDSDPELPGGPGNPASRRKRNQYLTEAYGRPAANIAQAIATRYRRAIDGGRLTPGEAYEQTVENLREHPRAEPIVEDIERHERLETVPADEAVDGTELSTETGVSPTAVGDTASISITHSERKASSWGVAATSQSISVANRRMSTNARVTGIGGATSYTRLYGRITPSRSIGGATRIRAKYYRLGNLVGGNAGVHLWVRETARPDTIVREKLESLGRADGTTIKNTQLTLPAGVQHDVGIELRTGVNTIASAYFYADYYFQDFNSQRRLQLSEPILIESLD